MKKLGKPFACLLMVLSMFLSPALAKDRELKIARWDDINTFDPGWLTSMDRELTIMRCLYNGLVKYKEGTWEESLALGST